MAAIDVGSAAIDRFSAFSPNYTIVDKDNPANASGKLTSVEIWAATDLTGVIVGTFYTTNGDTLKCRDSQAVSNVAAGSKQTKTVDITVEAGDWIGIYFTGGSIERDTTGYIGVWYVSGEYIDPDDQADYSIAWGDAISLYGIGETVEVGRSFGYIMG